MAGAVSNRAVWGRRCLAVTAVRRVAVGPPPASIALWLIDPPDVVRPRATIIVLHGLNDGKASMVGVGRALAAAGYRCVLMDLRGHGRSSGKWAIFGVVESRDLSQVIDNLVEQGLQAGPMGIFGTSYGGAAAIQTAGRDSRVAPWWRLRRSPRCARWCRAMSGGFCRWAIGCRTPRLMTRLNAPQASRSKTARLAPQCRVARAHEGE